MTSTPQTQTAQADGYRFTRFTTPLLLADLRFDRSAPKAGDHVPAFDLETLDGNRIRDTDLGPLPVLLVFGSRTCPVTESAGPVLRRLHDQFADRVRFLLVNTREAHPGDKFGQPHTMAAKREHAEELRRHHDLPFEVAVDDLDGDLHRAMSPKPNSAYLIGTDGVILYRAHWANDERGLTAALAAATDGAIPARGNSRAMIGPLMRAVGHLPGVIRFAGRRVEHDVWLAAPPLAALARASRLVSGLPPDLRGPAAAALMTIITGALLLGAARIGA
jgi:hypothetical protein